MTRRTRPALSCLLPVVALAASIAATTPMAPARAATPMAPARAATPIEPLSEATVGTAAEAAMRSTLVAAADAMSMEIDRDLRADAGGLGGGERVVKGAPYCAEAVHETVQWLPDPTGAASNRIVRQNITRLCRDGEGRTRQEVDRAGRRLVYLRDPVAREGWVLDPQRKTARRFSGGSVPLDAMVDAASWRDYAEQMREWARATADAARAQARPAAAGGTGAGVPLGAARPPTPSAPPTSPVPATPLPPPAAAVGPLPPLPAVISRIERAGPREAEVTVLRMERDGSRGDFPVPPPAVQWRATHLAPRGPGTTTALPGRDIEGVRANGERTTWVIEAGRVGNERPIQIVREVWTAPELLLTVSSRDFDPRSGEVNYRLKDLKRGEPEADLMRVPADYTRHERGGSRGGGASAPRG